MSLPDLLPPPPPAELDGLLDATERCVVRHGLRRTSMTDIAKEMNVSRPTLYRQVSSVNEALGLVQSRVLHQFLNELGVLFNAGPSPQAFVEAAARAVTVLRSHPVVQRGLTNEPDVLGELITYHASDYLGQIVDQLTPLFAMARDGGAIGAEPELAAGWFVRSVLVLVLLPFPDDQLESVVESVLLPMLLPDSPPS